MLIAVEEPGADDVVALLRAHVAELRSVSPPGSSHALDLDGLRAPAVTFWTARDDGVLLGCAALKHLEATHAEVKSMRTTDTARRRGVAAALLTQVLAQAAASGFRRVSLETGSFEFFAPARALYARFGFTECPPFGDYVPDPASTFMTRRI